MQPVPNVLLSKAQRIGQGGLAAKGLDCQIECIHADRIQQLFSADQQLWFADRQPARSDGRMRERKPTKKKTQRDAPRSLEGAGNLGSRVAYWREKRGLSQIELSEKISGLSQQALSALESRDSKTSEVAAQLADVLEISLYWLVSGHGKPEPQDWPFPGIERSRFDALSRDQQIEIQGLVRERIEKFEGGASGGWHTSDDLFPPTGTDK
jgi:ribosome-binding protein aMBF1 (putative translation factor)